MAKVDYWVSKVKWDENHKNIILMLVHRNNDNSVDTGEEKARNWIVQKLQYGYVFKSISVNEKNTWIIGSEIYYNNGLRGHDKLPLIQTKRKTFISYYHNDDSEYKKKFLNLTSGLIGK